MWRCSDLKNDAKGRLKGNYWNAFLVTLVAALTYGGGASFGGSSAGNSSNDNLSSLDKDSIRKFLSQFTQQQIMVFITTFLAFFIIIILASYLIRIFVGYPFEVGKVRFFIVNTKYRANAREMGWGFKHQYMHLVGVLFIRDLKIFLWSLLFVIPGIVKSYEYRMVPYIISENPNITTQRAFEISREMTMGEKANLFVLDLSFIGWKLLGVLACCIGSYFVLPYIEATFAEFYRIKRDAVLQSGRVSSDELCGVERYGA